MIGVLVLWGGEALLELELGIGVAIGAGAGVMVVLGVVVSAGVAGSVDELDGEVVVVVVVEGVVDCVVVSVAGPLDGVLCA
jgi:hypothetical protein